MTSASKRDRCFLFLQGPLSSFYSEIAAQLMSLGYPVLRVNFCGNDAVDWKHSEAINYRERPDRWEPFLQRLIETRGVTDIIFHGDRRYYHVVAAQVARANGVDVAATELGYLRPDWMTLERGACSTLSHFPIEPDRIRAVAAHYGPPDLSVRFPSEGWRLVAQELRFTLFNALLWPLFPHYRNHRPESRTEVYCGWLWARLTQKKRERRSVRLIDEVRRSGAAYYLVALQLAGDFQLREHSPFTDTGDALRFMARSFSRNADRNSLLVLKSHPLEYRHRQLRQCVRAVEKEFDLDGRIILIDAGNLTELSKSALGFVTVNSSAGFDALAAGCPSISIMPTIYDIAGLTFQGDLDDFWVNARAPDAHLFEDLRRALAGAIQVRGTLYNPDGLKFAARAMAEHLADRTLNANGAFVPEPPRLAKAARMGVTYATAHG